MSFPSRFGGHCAACGGAITAGDQVEWRKETSPKVWHPACYHKNGSSEPVKDFTGEPQVERVWSDRQNAMYDHTANEIGSKVVIAVAGSGKTTSVMEDIRRVIKDHPEASVRYVVFNTKNAKEAKAKIPAGADCGTFHSVCNNELQNFLMLRFQTEWGNKIRIILRNLAEQGYIDRDAAFRLGPDAVKLVEKAKGAGIGVKGLLEDTDENWVELADRFDIDFEKDLVTGIELSRRLLSESNDCKTMFDFNDMLYMCALFDVPMHQFDYLYVDEAQDFNAIQRFLCHKMLKPGGRLIAVGDPYQSIYGFRGADFDAIERIKEEFDCIELPLDISYRCPQAVVAEAQKYVPHIQPSPTAKMGSVTTHDEWAIADFQSGDAVLCRNNAPLVSLAYKMLARQIPCKVMGREIGQGLIKLIDKMRAFELDDLEQRLMHYRDVEVARLVRSMKEAQAQALEDKVDSITVVIGALDPNHRTIEALKSFIKDVFSDGPEGVTLSSVHKAKGLEWPRVFILDRWLIPSKFAKKPEQQEQENHIVYVAVTRAQEELHFIDSQKVS